MTSEDTEPPGNEIRGSAETDTETRANRRVREKVDRLFELVPPIGTRWRWYDIPYRFFRWWLTSWRRSVVPWRLRRQLNRGINFLSAFDHFERTKVEPLDDPMDNLIVPSEEGIRQGGLWIVELFPPSHYATLERALRRNGWDTDSLSVLGGTNAEQVRRAREGRGFSWARIVTVARPNSKHFFPDAKRESLAEEFESVEISAVQIGTSVTAIVGHFSLSDFGETALNKVWTATHQPRLDWRGLRRPQVLNRYFSAIQATQLERQRIHDVGRRWLADRCGGFFAPTEAGQPVMDLNIFNSFDPTTQPVDRSLGGPLRALGMEYSTIYNYVSDQIPGAVLMPAHPEASDPERIRNCWAIAGSYDRLVELNERSGYGEKPYQPSTLGAMFDNAARAFILHVAVMHYLGELRARYSLSRDWARTRHGRFSARRLRHLRDEILTTSLDLPAVARDTKSLWSDQWRRWHGIHVVGKPAPGPPDSAHEEFDLIERLGESRAAGFEELLADDKAYRTVLTTVASLGSSADATSMGRLALVIAGVSLLVALISLLNS